MHQCSIYDKSLKFSRLIYGLSVLVAYFIQSRPLLLLISILTFLGALSLDFNIPYRVHEIFQKKKAIEPSDKDFGELSFVSAATGILLLIGYLIMEFTPYEPLAWIYVLIVDAMIFLACLVGFCVATLMYVLIKNALTPKHN